MNLAELRTYITARYATPLTATEINQHIHEAYNDLSRIFTPDSKGEATVPTVSHGDQYYVADCRTIKDIRTAIDGDRLREINYEAVLYPRRYGTPIRWYPLGESSGGGVDVRVIFGLDPLPDVNDSVYVHFEPAPRQLAADTDAPDFIPEEYHYLIAWGALATIAGHAEDYGVAQYWETQYRSAYNGILLKLGRTAPTHFPTIVAASQMGTGGKK